MSLSALSSPSAPLPSASPDPVAPAPAGATTSPDAGASPARPAASDSPGPTPSAPSVDASSTDPEAQPTLAGREAAEGRRRPGRALSPQGFSQETAPDPAEDSTQADESLDGLTEPDARPAAIDPAPAMSDGKQVPSTSHGAGRSTSQALDGPSARQVRRVSMGAGIALIGLGLGFLALRFRHPN
ncbi:hypothetical protein [Streptomyces sp. NPDC047985]|uniref:hypothetical protein n=1 Tax=unclassified Streptomyces TaxID=2593676 RepID=UPI00343BA56E